MSKRIALVTVLYKSAEVLEKFIQSLKEQTCQDWLLYVVDNNEDDVDFQYFHTLIKKYNLTNFEYIQNKKNLGISVGNNQGIKESLKNGFNYTLLLNNDIYFDENTLKDTIDFTFSKKIDVLVPKIYYAGSNRIWMAGGKISKLKGTTIHKGELQEDKGQFDVIEVVEYAPTCFMLINNKVFLDIGLIDERYFVYYDDTDFVFRMNKQGYKIIYYPNVQVHHRVSFSTGGSESNFSIYQGNKNRILFLRKNYSFFYKNVALIFFYLTRILKYIKYNSSQRGVLLKALKDGRSYRE